MPNQRSKDQTLIALALDKRLLALVDQARGDLGRSAWIREAIAEELKRIGHPIEPEMVSAPDRTKIDRSPEDQQRIVKFAASGIRDLDLDKSAEVIRHSDQENERKERKRLSLKKASEEERVVLAGALRAAGAHESPSPKQKAAAPTEEKGAHVEAVPTKSTAKHPAPQAKARK